MRFDKYHGLGNDFIVVDVRGSDPTLSERAQHAAVVEQICQRRFGVGGDGVLAISEPQTDGATAHMRVLNADGSEAEMCGNGLRCVVKHLLDGTPNADIVIDTGAGPLRCRAFREDDTVATVQVDMGRPLLNRGDIPMTGPASERAVRAKLDIAADDSEVDASALRFTAVSMGNPHAITFVEQTGAELRALAESIGPSIENHDAFPSRTNVEFARVVGPNDIELVVWERGSGITLACGTGACATVVAAILEGHCNAGEVATVRLLGGDLQIEVASDLSSVLMTGPAEHVFAGDLGSFL